MGRTTSPTLLDYVLLGLLRQKPRSGYDVRRLFATTPLIHFSDSPGSIYPALLRLQRRGLIEGARPPGTSRRLKQLFAVTPKGLAALKAWLADPVTRADVISNMPALILRSSCTLDVLGPEAAGRFLEAFRREVRAYLSELKRYYASAVEAMPLSGQLAMESGLAGYQAQLRWAAGALAKLGSQRRREQK